MIYDKMPKVATLNDKDAEVFSKYFAEQNGEFYFEGCWLRNQRPENKIKSGYTGEETQRRRYIHFYDTYVLKKENNKNYLCLKNHYIYVTNTLPKEEIDEYYSKIEAELKKKRYKKNGNIFTNGDMTVEVYFYNNHPQNTSAFPQNYVSLDIVIKNAGYDYSQIQDRMWKLSRKMYRMPEKRENPTITTDVKDITKYLPAQVEMGCGPSISAKIPPLYRMHEMYKVQNHITGHFYFANEDNLILSIIQNPYKMFRYFASTPLMCIRAKHTQGYKNFGKLYKKGYFKGIVYNNNFDRLVKRLDIKEKILRIYDINEYIAKPQFEDDVKSLICMGCHADRRQVERQAREKGLKIIFIDPEGFFTKNGFEEYKIEGPRNEDIILKMPFEEAMQKLSKLLK